MFTSRGPLGATPGCLNVRRPQALAPVRTRQGITPAIHTPTRIGTRLRCMRPVVFTSKAHRVLMPGWHRVMCPLATIAPAQTPPGIMPAIRIRTRMILRRTTPRYLRCRVVFTRPARPMLIVWCGVRRIAVVRIVRSGVPMSVSRIRTRIPRCRCRPVRVDIRRVQVGTTRG